MLVTFVICFKQHFDTRYLAFCNLSPPRIVMPLDLLSEYRIQHGAIGPFSVTSSHSTCIFFRGVSDFATDCPCDVLCRRLTTCLLYVASTLWKWNFKQQVGCMCDIMDCKSVFLLSLLSFFLYFDICNRICLYTPYAFLALSLLLK